MLNRNLKTKTAGQTLYVLRRSNGGYEIRDMPRRGFAASTRYLGLFADYNDALDAFEAI